MAPGSSGAGAHAGTGTVPKSKVRNNSAVPQEAVTPTRRDTLQAHPLHALHALHPLHPHLPHHALAATSLDWVPVSEYNTRANYGQSSRKTTNHSTADHDYSDLDNSISLESGAGRFVPVRPQPRALPLPAQHREGMAESVDDGAGSGPPHLYNHNQYPQLAANGVSPHANHATAAVMIVNPTTPITVTGHTAQPFNVPGNTNRNNLARAYHSTRNGTDGPTNNNTLHVNNNTGPVTTNGRAGTKTNNLMNNVFEPGPGSAPHNSDAAQSGGGGESVRAMGEAMVSSCPDAASVERRLGQIREYIRVTSSLVDTMRNSEDEEMSVRPMSVQSNGSAYSDSDLWQSELKAKMEVSQQRLAALQEQQKRLLKYQAEAKHQLAEMHHINRNRQSQENLPHHSAPQDNHHANATQNHLFQPNHQAGRIYNPNQIGVATTLPHAVDTLQHQNTAQVNVSSGSLQETYHTVSSHSMELNGPSAHGHHQVPGRHQEDRYPSRSANIAPEEPQGRAAAGAETGGEGSEEEEQELLNEHGRVLQHKLRDLQLKKQHMEQLVADFQKLQAAERGARNTYSSSPEDSGAEDGNMHHGKCNKSEANIKNQDPFALVEISAIKAALQKTKDLMRRAERYEPQDSAGMHDDAYQLPSHSNINDNKSEGGGSAGGWSNDSSLCRVRNSIQHKITNHTPQHSATAAIQEQEASISSLQMLAQQLRQEAQSIADERKRLKQSLSKKDGGSKLSQKKVNAELGSSRGGSGCGGGRVSRGEARGSPGPMERKQIELQAELAEKQRQLEMILHKENELCGEVQNSKADSFSYAAMNQSYNSEQEEGESRADDVIFPAHSQHQPDSHHYRSADGSVYGDMMASALPPHLTNIYCSDSDSGTRGKSSQRMARNRRIRPPPLEHPPQDTPAAHVHSRSGSAAGSVHAEHRSEPTSAPALPPHLSHLGENINSSAPYPHMPPPAWCAIKSNQDVRTNQFTQNSHSQTMERLLGAQQVPFPPSVPFNMMMPYGMMGGGACGCSWWGPWCWQQLAAQQRELQQLRDQLNNVEERWRAETAPHALNNQVPPGNRANNYWDNFRSYSRQNLLSANSKTNANGHLGNVQPHNPHPLVERSHNTLHPSTLAGSAPLTPPTNTPKRNTNSATALLHNPVHQQPLATEEPIARHGRRNISYDTSHTFYTAPDVLNINQNVETDSNVISSSRIVEETIIAPMHCVSNVNINHRDDPLTERNLNMANPIPEIIQSHSNNLNSTNSFNNKKKSSSKLPAKNSSNRRNYSLDFVQNSNMDIASTSELPNLNLASSSHDARDKSTSKLFDLLRENVYSEVTALISANETHPDFLIQLFRDLQQLSSDSLRQHALQSIRDVLCQFSGVEGHAGTAPAERRSSEITLSPINNEHQNTVDEITISSSRDRAAFVDRDIINFMLAKSEETCTPELLETLKSLIIGAVLDAGHSMINSQKRLKEFLSKYEGARLREVSGDIIDNLVSLASAGPEQEELTRQPCDISESSILQDVAGSLNIFSSSDSQLHQMNLNVCSYDPWAPGGDSGVGSSHQPEGRFTQEAKVDLIDSVEMYNGDLAEADQTCHSEAGDPVGARALDESPAEMLPDVVETEEATPTEAEAEWVGLDRVPTRLHTDDAPANQKD